MTSPPLSYGPDGIPNTEDDITAARIENHLRDQAGVPDGYIRLSDGRLRPEFGRVDTLNGDDSS